MSVFMTLRVKADPTALERYAGEHGDAMRSLSDAAQSAGAIHHRFVGSDDGELMVLDEWESREAFQAFYDTQGEQIGQMMQAAGVAGEPQITFWRPLETHEEF
jgi:heme-degrading monooxygenase HmoA